MDGDLETILTKQGYGISGSHSAVKLCHWLRQKLLHGRACYKESFYGIESHRCLQMTPWLDCNQRCLFCWRYQGAPGTGSEPVGPVELLDDSIEVQRRLVSGYKGIESVDEKMWEESRDPNQIAISLAGEPTMYPMLGGFIDEAQERGMTTFLVTNGTRPEAIESLDPLPTQLYISIDAPNESIYDKLCVPMEKGLWDSIGDSLDLFQTVDTRTVVRHTLVKGWNLGHVSDYAKLVARGEPDYIEAKGYVFVGYSRMRMTIDNMPPHSEVMEFSERLADETGYEVTAERKDSRVVLLTKDGKLPRESRPF